MTTIETTTRDVAFHAFARGIEDRYGVGSWQLAPEDVGSDASNVVFEVRVPAEEIDDAPWALAELARIVKGEHGYRFTAITLEAEPAAAQ